MKMKKTALLLALVMSLALLCSCARESTTTVYVMDTFAEITMYPKDKKTEERITEMLYDLEGELSATSGALSRINEAGGGETGEHTKALLALSEQYYKETNGAFSPYLGSLIELWGVGSKNHVPTEEELSGALSASVAENVERDGEKLVLKDGVRLDFGAIAKGYATDVIKSILEEEGTKGAVIFLGGNVYVHGTKPNGELYRVAIRDPKGNENDWILALELSNKFIISSGDYERYFEENGVRYHHIFSPETGYPAESDLRAICVIADSGALADAYSTALYVMGSRGAIQFWREHEGFELVLVGRDGTVTLTEGIGNNFIINNQKDYKYEVAKR